MINKINGFSQGLVNHAFAAMTDLNVLATLSSEAANKAFKRLKPTMEAFAKLIFNQAEVSEFALKNAIDDLRAHIEQETIDSKNLENKAHETMRQLLALINKLQFDISLV